MTLKSKICKYLDYERKGRIELADLSIVFLYAFVVFAILFVINLIIAVGLIVPMLLFDYEPTFVLGSFETFPILYSLTSIIYGIIYFICVIIPIFAIMYFIFSKTVIPIYVKIGNITILNCDLKEKNK